MFLMCFVQFYHVIFRLLPVRRYPYPIFTPLLTYFVQGSQDHSARRRHSEIQDETVKATGRIVHPMDVRMVCWRFVVFCSAWSVLRIQSPFLFGSIKGL